MLFIYNNNLVRLFWNYHGTFVYLYIYIKIVICNGNILSWRRLFSAKIPLIWINFLHQISLPDIYFSSFIKWCFDMEYPYGNSPSKYQPLFSRKSYHSGNIEVLSSVSSIWEDDHIEKLENNQWICLWCNFKIYSINVTKALSYVIGIKSMHKKIFIKIQMVTENLMCQEVPS